MWRAQPDDEQAGCADDAAEARSACAQLVASRVDWFRDQRELGRVGAVVYRVTLVNLSTPGQNTTQTAGTSVSFNCIQDYSYKVTLSASGNWSGQPAPISSNQLQC